MGQPEFDRIPLGQARKLIHARLDRKHVGKGTKRTQGGGAQHGLTDQVIVDLAAREPVNRHGIARAAPTARRREVGKGDRRRGRIPVRPGEAADSLRHARPLHVCMAPDVFAPGLDHAAVIERRRDAHQHRRSVRRPGEFVLTRPLDPNGSACEARQHRRVHAGIVGSVMPIAPGAVGVDHGDVIHRDVEHQGELAAQGKASLALRPYRQTVIVPARQRAGGADRGMREERARVLHLEAAPGRRD